MLGRGQISIYHILNDLGKNSIIDYIKNYTKITKLKKSLTKDELIDIFKENMFTKEMITKKLIYANSNAYNFIKKLYFEDEIDLMEFNAHVTFYDTFLTLNFLGVVVENQDHDNEDYEDDDYEDDDYEDDENIFEDAVSEFLNDHIQNIGIQDEDIMLFDETYDILSELNFVKIEEERVKIKPVRDFIYACINYYKIVSFREIITLLAYYKIEIIPENYAETVFDIYIYTKHYVLDDNVLRKKTDLLLFHRDVLDYFEESEEDPKAFINRKMHVPKYKNLLKYESIHYDENESLFEKLLEKLYDINISIEDSMIIMVTLKYGLSINISFEEIFETAIPKSLSKTNVSEVYDILKEVYDNYKNWHYRKLTNKEYTENFEKLQKPENKTKPNEPCHCGSGKKYKKCCGKIA